MYVRLGTGCAYFRASAFASGSRTSHARFFGMAGRLELAARRGEGFLRAVDFRDLAVGLERMGLCVASPAP